MHEVIPENYQDGFFRRLTAKEDNSTCADCKNKGTGWTSLSFGVFICINCAGVHRRFGMHITRVRSLKLDSWTRGDAELMERVGNRTANLYWEHQPGTKPTDRHELIRLKYEVKRWVRIDRDNPVQLLERSNFSLSAEQLAAHYRVSSQNKEEIPSRVTEPLKTTAVKNGEFSAASKTRSEPDLLDFLEAETQPSQTSTKNSFNTDFLDFTSEKAQDMPSGSARKSTTQDFDFNIDCSPQTSVFNIQSVNIFNAPSNVNQAITSDKYAVLDRFRNFGNGYY